MMFCIVLLCLVAGLNSRRLEQDGDHVPLSNSRNGLGVEGLWEGKFSLSIRRIDSKTLSLDVTVANTISCTVTEKDGKFVSGGCGGSELLSPCDEELERRVYSMLGNITGLRREGDTLVLESNEDKEIFNPAPQPNPGN